MKVHSRNLPLSYTDGGAVRELVIINRAIPSDYSFQDVRNALKEIEDEWNNHHYLPKVYGAFDCDGSVTTDYSKRISRNIVNVVEGCSVEVIIEHHKQANT
tara:strand:- start:831 stop:1133 length:303 start_codon:yes stop_codon:yes gene_type:complete